METKEEKALRLLKEARHCLFSSGPQAVNAIYISPAQQLRNQAEEIERQDSLIREIDEFLNAK